jgi:trans-aconitate 3-methyltransferase
MQAHWFNLEEFWPRAAQLVKVGGTVAVWTVYCRKPLENAPNTPDFDSYQDSSTPSAASVQNILGELEDGVLGPYETHSNRLSRNMYDQLIMPWDTATTGFSPKHSKRLEWNRNGKLEVDEVDFFGGSEGIWRRAWERQVW